ncbi:activator-dependent family glycosyltransferase [Micromonospora sp. RB23]
MRVLFVAPPALASHLFVLTPLAWALRTAGHDVRVATQPDLAESITQAGLTGVLVGSDMGETLMRVAAAEPAEKPAAPDHPRQEDYAREDPFGELDYLTRHLLRHLCPDDMLDELVGFARAWRPDLVVWDGLSYAGAVVARACGAAHARMLFGADGYVQLRTAALRRRPDRDPLREWLEPLLERYGSRFDDDVLTGDWTIDTQPPWMWRPQGARHLHVRPTAFNGPSIVPEWLHQPDGRPRVCLTLGVTHRAADVAEATAADLFEAVEGLDVEVVATLNAEQVGDTPVPANVRLTDFVPLNVLLPTCRAVVHHGGNGASASAYEHAVPQLVVPGAYWSEKWFGPLAVANGVEDQGAGVYVADSDKLTGELLRKALERVLSDPSYAHHAKRLRRELLAVPTPRDVVPLLEGLTAEHRRDRV